MERRAGQFQIGKKHGCSRPAVDHWHSSHVTQGPLCNLLVSLLAGVMKQKIGGAGEHGIFIPLRQRAVGGHKAGPARIAEAAIDKDNQTFRLREPLPVARGPIKREKSAGHGYIVTQVRSGCIVRAMTETSTRKGSIGQYPAGGLKGLITSIGVA